MSTVAVFLVLGGASAIAAKGLGKKTVGTAQLKGNAVTKNKIKKNSIVTPKIRNGAVATPKIRSNAVTGAKVNESTLSQVPSAAQATNSQTTDEVRSSQGSLPLGQKATAFEYGPLKLVFSCEIYEVTQITAKYYLESSTPGTVWTSWADGGTNLGPTTPENEREVTEGGWANSNGPYSYEGSDPFAATAASGMGVNGHVAMASEKDASTCWYWTTANVIG